MESKLTTTGIMPETLDILREIRKQTGLPHYRILSEAVNLYEKRLKAAGLKIKLVEETENEQ